MPERKLVLYPDPILEKVCEPVKLPLSQEDKELLDDMYKFIKDPQNAAIGLAAPQFGVAKRLIVVKVMSNNIMYCFKLANPRIIKQAGKPYFFGEGESCLSEPNMLVKVARANSIILMGFDTIQNKNITVRLSGAVACVVQHEMDHLDGVLLHHYAKEDK